MAAETSPNTATVIPGMRYRDAPAAIKWLCSAFGFQEHLVVPGEDGTIVHAQLTYGDGMIMLGSIRDGEYDRMIRQPADSDGLVTQAPYIIVPDADAHYAQAKAAGAEIVMDIADQDHGGRAYACRDPEGHLWNFGTYNPWQKH